MRLVFTLLLGLWSVAAQAAIETWPALYDVVDVAPDDVLNIRAGQSASSEIIGTLPFNGTGIEVVDVDEDRRWGLVNTAEGSGWVSLRFMEKQPRWAGSYPPITSCYGTEPFWDLRMDAAGGTFTAMDGPSIPVTMPERLSSANRIDRFSFVSRSVTGVVTETRCRDGMSDRTFGISIELLITADGANQHLSGCCSIQP